MQKLLILGLLVCMACQSKSEKPASSNSTSTEEISDTLKIPQLNLKAAEQLAGLPLQCMNQEYPNKLGQVLGNDEDLLPPRTLHPAFYGCFDWHSSVHGHWSLVSLLKQFPQMEGAESIKAKLLANISSENIAQEVQYFEGTHNKTFERTYGWAWLLKLAEELHTWNDPVARTLETNLQPLSQLIVAKYLEFLPKLNYPIRVGEHPNTAFGLSFAYDYAKTLQHEALQSLIEKRATDFYFNDQECPLSWEPSGFDFLSPCLEEAALMKRILPTQEYIEWLQRFLPSLFNTDFSLPVGEVSDRTDGKLVHLDGVNFSRAWCINTIAEDIPQLQHLKQISYRHIHYSLPNLIGDSYEGGHWLGSFAIYALNTLEDGP